MPLKLHKTEGAAGGYANLKGGGRRGSEMGGKRGIGQHIFHARENAWYTGQSETESGSNVQYAQLLSTGATVGWYLGRREANEGRWGRRKRGGASTRGEFMLCTIQALYVDVAGSRVEA